MATCRGPNCGAEIRWCKTRRGGSRIPLDEEPNSAGNVVIEADGTAVVLPNEAAKRYTGEKYMPHWVTCPDRNRFKSSGRLRAVVLLILMVGCITPVRKAEQFEWWTRKWEVRMGLEEKTQIRIGPTPAGSCGWVGLETQIGKYGPEFFLVTVYDPEKRGCQSPWTIALHEACHRRMQHHHIEINRPNAEAEVAECMEWYR